MPDQMTCRRVMESANPLLSLSQNRVQPESVLARRDDFQSCLDREARRPAADVSGESRVREEGRSERPERDERAPAASGAGGSPEGRTSSQLKPGEGSERPASVASDRGNQDGSGGTAGNGVPSGASAAEGTAAQGEGAGTDASLPRAPDAIMQEPVKSGEVLGDEAVLRMEDMVERLTADRGLAPAETENVSPGQTPAEIPGRRSGLGHVEPGTEGMEAAATEWGVPAEGAPQSAEGGTAAVSLGEKSGLSWHLSLPAQAEGGTRKPDQPHLVLHWQPESGAPVSRGGTSVEAPVASSPRPVSLPDASTLRAGVARAIGWTLESGVREMVVQIRPPELGRLEISLKQGEDGRWKTHVRTEQEGLRDILASGTEQIRGILNDLGMAVDAVEVSLAGPQDWALNPQAGHEAGAEGAGDGQGRGGDGRESASTDWGVVSGDTVLLERSPEAWWEQGIGVRLNMIV